MSKGQGSTRLVSQKTTSKVDGMPEIVDDLPYDPDEPPPTRYPWDEWADGKTRRFTADVDFHTTPRDFARQIRRAAWARGMRAIIQQDKGTVVMRMVPRRPTDIEE